ncbi:MAG: haloacid dehalogenase-like hydrolase [Ruminococcus sp.]|uniref:haloacid dehalogenase-like hydrolase n=1 Tax=Ruminococcus sp. TaxID=41978 RepID=UPI0025D11E21|nr:haloacid dehalogenase-like hydrolase [Ruminococcus sp.]MCR5601159.1 haloacid dehalogenase-like hydrolase [Ruminococcus sp.]
MKVFDFDNTIYRGESSVDLALFMIKNNKKILLYLPSVFYNMIKYKLCLVKKEKLLKKINNFMSKIIVDRQELMDSIEQFWKKKLHKLDRDMLKRIKEDDVIITAGPDFLIHGIKKLLNTKNIISSEIDDEKNEMKYFNFGDNKVRRYKEIYGNKRINCLFTDSYNDRALMDIADKVFIVKKGKLKLVTK